MHKFVDWPENSNGNLNQNNTLKMSILRFNVMPSTVLAGTNDK